MEYRKDHSRRAFAKLALRAAILTTAGWQVMTARKAMAQVSGFRNPADVARYHKPAAAGGGGCTTAQDAFNATVATCTTDGSAYIMTRFTAVNTYLSCKGIMYLKRTGTLAGTWNMQIWSHNAGPNFPLANLATSDNNPAIGTTYGDITFTNLAYNIQSGTTYWVGIYHSTGGDFSGIFISPADAASGAGTKVAVGDTTPTWADCNTNVTMDFQLFS